MSKPSVPRAHRSQPDFRPTHDERGRELCEPRRYHIICSVCRGCGVNDCWGANDTASRVTTRKGETRCAACWESA